MRYDTDYIPKDEVPSSLSNFIVFWQKRLEQYPDPDNVDIAIEEGFGDESASYRIEFQRPSTPEEEEQDRADAENRAALEREFKSLQFTHIRYPAKPKKEDKE